MDMSSLVTLMVSLLWEPTMANKLEPQRAISTACSLASVTENESALTTLGMCLGNELATATV